MARPHRRDDEENDDGYDECYEHDDYDVERYWPSRPLLVYNKASCIALFDIFALSMVYAGSNLAGPTISSIIYSSVTMMWAALSVFQAAAGSLVVCDAVDGAYSASCRD